MTFQIAALKGLHIALARHREPDKPGFHLRASVAGKDLRSPLVHSMKTRLLNETWHDAMLRSADQLAIDDDVAGDENLALGWSLPRRNTRRLEP